MRRKEKLYISDIVDDPVVGYPSYYVVSEGMARNEMLHASLEAIHTLSFSPYVTPSSYENIFKSINTGAFPVYKERYVVGRFGGKLMYLEANGWRALPASEDIFTLENWLVP